MVASETTTRRLCEFGVDDVRVLLPFILFDPHLQSVSAPRHMNHEIPHLLECTQTRKNAAACPRGVDSFRGCQDLDAHVLDRQPLHLVEQSVAEAFRQRGASGKHNVAVERFAEVHVRPVDGLDYDLMHARVLETDDLGIEQNFRRPETFRTNLRVVSQHRRNLAASTLTLSFCPSGSV
jgi:hypothetical protein